MSKFFYCKAKKSILFKEPNLKSEHLKEVIFGEIFIMSEEYKDFYYGFTQYDRYFGYVKKNEAQFENDLQTVRPKLDEMFDFEKYR